MLSYRTAKSLAVDLAGIIRQHEQVHGEIPLPASGPEAAPASPGEGA